jgi:hypothetical protein
MLVGGKMVIAQWQASFYHRKREIKRERERGKVKRKLRGKSEKASSKREREPEMLPGIFFQ